jgi:antimicrobial peptide system SdpB family protein
MLGEVGRWAFAWTQRAPWTNVYGLTRSLIAAATLVTLLVNDPHTLMRPAQGQPRSPSCVGPGRHGLFCVLPADKLELARWIAIVILLAVIVGWRPRLTALPHWWVAFSVQWNAVVLDGGDQVALVAVTLILPLALTDGRRWHWDPPASPPDVRLLHSLAAVVAWSAVIAFRVQAAVIYLNASIAKLRVEEWVDGTAVYYYMLEPRIGMPDWQRTLLTPVLESPTGVALLSWGTIVLEFALFTALLVKPSIRKRLLPFAIAYHLSIAVIFGLFSFSLTMTALLILFLWPADEPLRFTRLARLRARLPRRQRRAPDVAAESAG